MFAVTAYSAFKTPATTELFFDLTDRAQIADLLTLAAQARDVGLPILHI